MIRILHLSDFHCKNNHPDDFIEMGKRICENVKENLGSECLDLIVFSGDLVYTGGNKELFVSAVDYLFRPLQDEYGLTNDQILLAPGNHDRTFNSEMPMVKSGVDACKTIADLEAFCNIDEQLDFSVVDQKKYIEFVNDFYNDNWHKTPLYWARVADCDGHKIGLLSLNSAWRCCGDSKKDRGNLLFPPHMLRKALGEIRDSEFIICTEHHNILDYQEYVSTELEDLLHEKCHILFTGHHHKASVNVNHDAEVGMIHISAPASYNRNDSNVNFGYSIISLDVETKSAVFSPYIYTSLQFTKGHEISISVPMSQEKIKQNDFRRLLRKRYQETETKADVLFVNHGQGMFLKMFKDPIIKNKSVQEIITSHREGARISLNEIEHQTKSIIIFGYGKRGKTSLLRKIELDVLNEALSERIIPYYFNYAQYKGKNFNLKDLLRTYLEMNCRETDLRFEKHALLLLIDDLNPTDSTFMKMLETEMSSFPNCRFIATAQESMSNQVPLLNFSGTDVDKYYIHDVTIREVHQLTKSWPSLTVEKRRDVEDKIIQIFQQMHIPLNYWSISLFLWIYAKTDNANVHNNFDLIRLYVDELLDAQNYISNPDFSLTFDDLKAYMGALAVEIMEKGYSMTDAELMMFTEDYKKDHNKFTDNPLDIINYLLDKGVLARDIDSKITIRLKGVFEYFIAYHMSQNSYFKDKVLQFRNSFMSFGNEWELYAGFCKDDQKSFEQIFAAIKNALNDWTSVPEFKNIDSQIHTQVLMADNAKEATGRLLNRLEQMPEDDNYDIFPSENLCLSDSAVHPKVFYDQVDITAANVERMVYVLARIYRNSNICDMKEFSNEIFEFVLDGACNLGFMLISEMKGYMPEESDNYMQVISNCIPIIVEAFFYDAIAQKNLTRIFEERLALYMEKPVGNQMRIFMLAMTLMDIDAVRYQGKVLSALSVLTNNVLRFSVLQKTLLNSIREDKGAAAQKALRPIRLLLSPEFYESYSEQEILERRVKDMGNQKAAIRNSIKEN